MIKVFICDDIEEIRIFFKNIINSSDDMEVVGTAGSGDEAIEKVLEIKPDIVLMDIQMETKTAGIDAVRKIYNANNKIKNIMLTVAIAIPKVFASTTSTIRKNRRITLLATII